MIGIIVFHIKLPSWPDSPNVAEAPMILCIQNMFPAAPTPCKVIINNGAKLILYPSGICTPSEYMRQN